MNPYVMAEVRSHIKNNLEDEGYEKIPISDYLAGMEYGYKYDHQEYEDMVRNYLDFHLYRYLCEAFAVLMLLSFCFGISGILFEEGTGDIVLGVSMAMIFLSFIFAVIAYLGDRSFEWRTKFFFKFHLTISDLSREDITKKYESLSCCERKCHSRRSYLPEYVYVLWENSNSGRGGYYTRILDV